MDLTLVTESFSQDDQRWLASKHGADTAQPATLDASKFAAADYADGFLPSGTVLAALGTTPETYGPYDPADTTTDAGVAVGILLEAVKVNSSTSKPAGAMVKHCFIDTAHMPFADDAKGGFDSGAAADLPAVVVR